ncbi:hypothetical protein PVAND_000301 [Polypedilum vanderplanki]|uniref:Uncharacterized protein n=1 Tax=Polypedilum vanderplanki TaxID=319348 RepID=A0A9J6BKX3_POLVA|nr:hypothetical protein PVAND_000301 [Polypedilum vanderplanki]
MKFVLAFLIAFAIFLKGTESFYGLNIIYPSGVKMSSACIKAGASTVNIPPKIDQNVKVLVKFKSDEYETAAQSLTDLRFFFIGMSAFIQQYSQFLVDQTSGNPLKIITLLIYNAQLMESATKQIETAPKNFAAIFGKNLESIMTIILGKFTEQITNLRISLETLEANFESISQSEGDVTVETLDGELDSQAIADTIAAFTEISVASNQMIMISNGMSQITQTLDQATKIVTKAADASRSAISLMTFTLNIEIQSAKFSFGDEVRSNVQTIVQSFGNYSKTSLSVFANTTSPDFLSFLQDQQNAIDDYGTAIGELLVRIQSEFSKRLQDYYSGMYEIITNIQAALANYADDLTSYIATLIVQSNGASFKSCFINSSDVQKQAKALMDSIQAQFISCVTAERTLTTQLQSLMTFIIEDVTINAQGAADRLCGCSVKGGKKVLEMTQDCIANVVDELTSKTIQDDEKYLTKELEVVDEVLLKSEERFTQCTANISANYEVAYERFQQAALACLVS